MHRRADAADPLGEGPGVARVAPFRMISIPRNMVEEDQASCTAPPSTSASMRRCPSMRVTGSTTTCVMTVSLLFSGVPLAGSAGRRLAQLLLLAVHVPFAQLHEAVGGEGRRDTGGRPACRPVDIRVEPEAGEPGQVAVERGHLVPEVGLGAADAGMAAADRPVGALVPADVGAVLVGHRPLAAHLVEAVAGAMSLVAPVLHVLAGVVSGRAARSCRGSSCRRRTAAGGSGRAAGSG